MTRDEIKNRLYFVADTIRMNADKFAAGEALENEDWVKAAKEFTSCMNYLMQTQRDFEEVRKEEEPYENPIPRNCVMVQVPVNLEHNGRRYRITKDCVDRFMDLPPKLRPASLGFPNDDNLPSCNGQVPYKVGDVVSIKADPEYNLVASVCVDSHRYRSGEILKTLIESGYAPKFTLRGEVEEDPDTVFSVTKLTHIAIEMPPASASRATKKEDPNG